MLTPFQVKWQSISSAPNEVKADALLEEILRLQQCFDKLSKWETDAIAQIKILERVQKNLHAQNSELLNENRSLKKEVENFKKNFLI